MPDSQDFRRLERTSRRSALVSFLGLAILIGSLIYGYVKINAINRQVALAEEELYALEARKDSIQFVLAQLYGEFEQADSIQAVQALSQAVSSAEAVQKTARVYLHIVDEDQRRQARDVAAALEAAGFVVPGIELVKSGPSVSELRFFRSAEATEARTILSVLEKRVPEVQLRDLSARYAGSTVIRPGHYELWVGPDF